MDEKEKEMIQRIKEDLMKIENSLLETALPRQLETPNPLLPEDDRKIRIENDVDAEGVACGICNFVFSSTVAMENHKRRHPHRGHDRRHRCPRCLYSTNHSHDFQKHFHTHTGEKRHKCHICDKAFIQKVNLKNHLMVHSGEKPFSCKICSKRFNREEVLRIHERTHSGVKPYRCPICGRDFTQSSSVKTHIHRKHSQQSTYDSPTEE